MSSPSSGRPSVTHRPSLLRSSRASLAGSSRPSLAGAGIPKLEDERNFQALDKCEEEDSQEAEDSDEDDEQAELEERKLQERLELLEQARRSTRRTMAPASLVESMTSRYRHFTEKMVVQLIEQTADVHARLEEPWDRSFDDYVQTLGATALHFAARRGLLQVITSLLDHAADVNASTHLGVTPIMVGVMFNQVHVVKTLVSRKASMLQKDNAGLCAVDLAIIEGRKEMIDLVMKLEAEENWARHDTVKKSMDALADSVSDVSDDDDESANVTKKSGNLSEMKLTVAGWQKQGASLQTGTALRSEHLLSAALQKAGLDMPTASPAGSAKAAPGGTGSLRTMRGQVENDFRGAQPSISRTCPPSSTRRKPTHLGGPLHSNETARSGRLESPVVSCQVTGQEDNGGSRSPSRRQTSKRSTVAGDDSSSRLSSRQVIGQEDDSDSKLPSRQVSEP